MKNLGSDEAAGCGKYNRMLAKCCRVREAAKVQPINFICILRHLQHQFCFSPTKQMTMANYLPSPVNTAIPLFLGLTASSFHLYGNVGASTSGLLPYVTSSDTNTSPYELVRAVNWFIARGKTTLFAPGIASGVILGWTAYVAEKMEIKQLCGVGAVAALAVFPWTVLMLLPVNNALAEVESAGEAKMQEEGEKRRAIELVEKWERLHVVRLPLGAVTWSCAALSMSLL